MIKRYLASLGDDLWAYNPVPSRFGTRTVDSLLCYKGFFFVIEVKAPGKKPTKVQFRELRKVERSGGAAFWVDGPDRLLMVKEWIALCDSEAPPNPLKTN